MKQFMFIFSGPTPEFKNGTPQEVASIQTEWRQIAQSLGGGVVDPGKIFVNDMELIDSGEVDDFVAMNGYMIVQAEDLSTVASWVRANPYMSRKDGTYSVMVFELWDPNTSTPPAIIQVSQVVAPVPSPEPPDSTNTTEEPAPPQPVPPAAPGELTIPHEPTPEDQQPPIPPTLPAPQ